MKLLSVIGVVLWSLSAPVGPSWAQTEPPPASHSIVSIKRLSLAGQIGYRYEGLANGLAGVAPIPYVRLAPAYALFGTPGKSTGSVSIVFPIEIGLDSANRTDFHFGLSVMIFDGSD